MSNINKILNLSKKGYKKNSPHVDRPFNVIPSNEITMKEDDGTPLKKGPILGIGIGKILEYKKMMPGKDYKFSDDVKYVIEKPLNEFEDGGTMGDPPPREILPTRYTSNPEPTVNDSIALYNNALAKNAFYANNPNYLRGTSNVNFRDPNLRRDLINRVSTEYSGSNITAQQVSQFNAPSSYIGQNSRFGRVPGTNLTSFGDIMEDYDGIAKPDDWFNPVSPPIYLHPNISPQGSISYETNNESKSFPAFDVTDMPYYDPIAVKPGRLLTPYEVAKRLKKYGTQGVPQSKVDEYNEVVAKQQQLIDAGYDIGGADGIWGKKSQAAWNEMNTPVKEKSVETSFKEEQVPITPREQRPTGLTKQVPKTVWKQLPNGTWYKDTKAGQNATVESTGTDIGGRSLQKGGLTKKDYPELYEQITGTDDKPRLVRDPSLGEGVLPTRDSMDEIYTTLDGNVNWLFLKDSGYAPGSRQLHRELKDPKEFVKETRTDNWVWEPSLKMYVNRPKKNLLSTGTNTDSVAFQQGGTIPKFQTGNEKRLTPQELISAQREQQIQYLPEQQIYATPESRKKYEDVYAKAQSIAKAFPRAAEYFTKNKRYKNQGIEGISEYIQDITNYQKDAEKYYKARQAVKKGRMSTEDFERAYRERGWQQFDSKNVKTSEEDQKELEETWYGPTDEQGRRYWMSNPMNVAKVAQGTAAAAVLGPGAVASGVAAPVGYVLSNPLVQAGLTGYGVYDATTNTLPEAYRDFSEGRYLEGLGNVGMAALDLAPIPLFGTNLLGEASQAGKYLTQGPLKNAYNKVATGNSRLPIAWKMENINDATPLVKNKYDLTDEEAFVLGKYINTPYAIQRGTEESKIFDNLIKRNSAVLDEVNTPVTKVLNHSTASNKDVVPSTFGSTFTFPGNRSWSAGVDPRFADTGRRRLVIPSKYNKDLGFTAVPYDDTRLVEGWNASSGSEPLTKLNMSDEKELIGNIPEGYKVIGKSNEGGFENIFIKPNRKFSNKYQQGGIVLDLSEDEIKNTYKIKYPKIL